MPLSFAYKCHFTIQFCPKLRSSTRIGVTACYVIMTSPDPNMTPYLHIIMPCHYAMLAWLPAGEPCSGTLLFLRFIGVLVSQFFLLLGNHCGTPIPSLMHFDNYACFSYFIMRSKLFNHISCERLPIH